MRPIPYSLEFRGFVSDGAPGVLRARATAPGTSFLTTIDEHGLAGWFAPIPSAEAVLEAELELGRDGSLEATGTITFGYGNVLRFRTLASGRLDASADLHLRQGTMVCEVEGGEGQFVGASGRIVSNLLLSDTGELTDNQAGLIFVGGADGDRPNARPVSGEVEET